jgi:5'-deoxynucleotidase YfbR-like HD superfamily hydrolase
MSKLSLSQIQKIFDELIVPFYLIERDMFVPNKEERAENDAEHSWSLAFMAFMLAPKIDKTINVEKAVVYAVVHDLVEIHAGDTSAWAPKRDHDSKQSRERIAQEKIISDFMDFSHLGKYLTNYHSHSDNESRFIYALDKFMNWLTVYSCGDYYYKRRNKITQEAANKKLEATRKKAYEHPGVGLYFDKLIKVINNHPEYFYPAKIN